MRNYKLHRTVKGAAETKLAAGAETAVVTITGVNTDAENSKVELEATVPFTTPLESSEQHLRCYRGGIGGTEIGSVIVKAGASAKSEVTLRVIDEPGEVVDQEYTFTLQDVAGKETVAHEPVASAQF